MYFLIGFALFLIAEVYDSSKTAKRTSLLFVVGLAVLVLLSGGALYKVLHMFVGWVVAGFVIALIYALYETYTRRNKVGWYYRMKGSTARWQGPLSPEDLDKFMLSLHELADFQFFSEPPNASFVKGVSRARTR